MTATTISATAATAMLTFEQAERIRAAMDTVAADLAQAIADDACHPAGLITDAAVVAAMRQPVTLASAYADLCAMLGIAPPCSVRVALSD